jgi:hypothetical protein
MGRERTGFLLVRVWMEENSALPLRAELRFAADVSAGFDRTETLVEPKLVGAAVQEWLEALVDRQITA